jgi:dUTP pyrophosphatase
VSVLSREELRAALAARPPLVEGIDQQTQLQPNGIDLRIDRVQRLTSPGLLGAAPQLREPAAREDVQPDSDGWWDLHAGSYVIGYAETVNLPTDVMALARPRSTLLRSGVAIHTAVWDAGYSGRGEGLLSVLNPKGYRLQRGAAVLQLVFLRLGAATAEGYRGKYQGEGQAPPATGPAGSIK